MPMALLPMLFFTLQSLWAPSVKARSGAYRLAKSALGLVETLDFRHQPAASLSTLPVRSRIGGRFLSPTSQTGASFEIEAHGRLRPASRTASSNDAFRPT